MQLFVYILMRISAVCLLVLKETLTLTQEIFGVFKSFVTVCIEVCEAEGAEQLQFVTFQTMLGMKH